MRVCRGLYQRLIARAVVACWHLGLMRMVLYGFAQHNCIDTALFCVLETTTVLRIVRGLARGGDPYLAGGLPPAKAALLAAYMVGIRTL